MSAGLLNLLMQLPQGMEWVFIIIIVVVVFFGVKKIPELARTFGKAGAEYEKARMEAKKEIQQLKSQGSGNVGREKLEEIADSLGINYTNKNDDELRTAIDAELNKTTKK
jgi:sec-independent protein translocase protein TatA